MRNTNFFAYALILIGVVLLLHQLEIIYFSRSFFVVFGSLLLGVLWFKKGLIHPEHKGILGGTFWILTGITLFLMTQHMIPAADTFGAGIVLLNLGIANVVCYVFSRRNISNLTAALIFALPGIMLVGVYYHWISAWRAADLFFVYWPVLLIIGGIYLIFQGILRHAQ